MHGPLTPDEIRRLRRLPAVSRAREMRLYMTDGTRWTDCWLDGGRALYGHRPGGMSKRIKNEIDRGLYAAYPSRWEGRLEKALARFFPGYAEIRVYRNADAALEALSPDSLPADPLELPSAAPDDVRRPGALWGRPLLPGHPLAEACLPVMPVAGLTEVQPVLFAEGIRPPAPSDIVSPVVLAALTRACLPGSRSGDGPRRDGIPSPDADGSEGGGSGGQQSGKLSSSPHNADIWERRGPYMLFRGTPDEYDAIFDGLFARRILIAPSPERPSFFPAGASEKERLLIARGGEG